MRSVEFADVIHAADVWMADLPREADFAEEVLQPLRIIGEVPRQELEGDGLPEFQIVGPVDLPHAAFADERDNSIPACDLRPGQKPPMVRTLRERLLAGT
jgi:hypothetical protein